MRGRVKLGGPHFAEIEFGGQRIENYVRALTIEAGANLMPQINLELVGVDEIDIEGNVAVSITPDGRKALIALGWTPPAEP